MSFPSAYEALKLRYELIPSLQATSFPSAYEALKLVMWCQSPEWSKSFPSAYEALNPHSPPQHGNTGVASPGTDQPHHAPPNSHLIAAYGRGRDPVAGTGLVTIKLILWKPRLYEDCSSVAIININPSKPNCTQLGAEDGEVFKPAFNPVQAPAPLNSSDFSSRLTWNFSVFKFFFL